jgi:hypothetical protein
MTRKLHTLLTAVGAATGLVLAASGCQPVSDPPIIGPLRYQPAGAGTFDGPVDTIGAGASSSARLIVAGRGQWEHPQQLVLERADASGPTGAPIVLDTNSAPEELEWWSTPSVVRGGDVTLVAAESFTYRDQDGGGYSTVLDLVGPGTSVRRISYPPSGDGSGTETAVPDVATAWNGSRFLVAARNGVGEVRVDTVSTGGLVTPGTVLTPGTRSYSEGSGPAVASAGNTFLVVYEDERENDVVLRARRFGATGAPLGGALTLATGAGPFQAAAAGSGGSFLVAWDAATDVKARTVSAAGVLGTTRTLVGATGTQQSASLVTAPNGGWQAVWSDGRNGATDVFGTLVDATGVAVTPGGRVLAGGAGDQFAPQVAAGPDGSRFFVYLTGDVETGDFEAFMRSLSAQGAPAGAAVKVGRVPVPQTATDVAGGSDRFLAVWQEARQTGNTNLFGQRFDASGQPIGAAITISSAAGDQFNPTVAWDGSTWLMTWTDRRSGGRDVYGTTVSPSGVVAPSAGFAISTATGDQQSPAVAFDGTNFVVAWNDGRHGNQDIFATRVRPDRTVLNPNGIAVKVGPGAQRAPTVGAAKGISLIGWLGPVNVEQRLLRSNGTFVGPAASVGPFASLDTGGHHHDLAAAGSPSNLALVYTDGTDAMATPRLVRVDPATGATIGTSTIASGWDETMTVDLAFDGRSYLALTAVRYSTPDAYATFIRPVTTSGAVGGYGLLPAARDVGVASLPNGPGLAAGSLQVLFTATVR